jgi:hypothetical protein
VGGGISQSAAADFSVSASAGAGFTATAGPAFADLRIAPPTVSVNVGEARASLLPAPRVAGAASFSPGGRAVVQGGGSLSANVGADAELHGRISFGS